MEEKVLEAFDDVQLLECISYIATEPKICVEKLKSMSVPAYKYVTCENLWQFGFGYLWDIFTNKYPKLRLPELGDGFRCNEKGELVSREDEFAEFRERLQKVTVIRHVCVDVNE